jgi:flagellar hook assembly protein FlgD
MKTVSGNFKRLKVFLKHWRSKTIAFVLMVLSAWGLMSQQPVRAQTCTPVSASLLGSADDQLTVWINGSGPYGPINYITAGTGAIPPIAIPPGVFNTTGPNIIAALNQDTTPSVVESSWVIDVTCSSGQHAYFSNTDAALKMYVSPCTSGDPPPPNDGSGNPWYSPSYGLTSTYFTATPVLVTAQAAPVWLQPMFNPQTGAVQPWIGMNNTAVDSYGGCTGLYYRESVTLNPQPYVPPTFSITKSANPTTIAQSYSAGAITYKLIVCNSGAPVNTPVTIFDTPQYNIGEYYGGPTYNFSPPTQIFSNAGAGEESSPTEFIFPNGFVGGGGCVTITYTMDMGDTEDAAITTCALVNQASVTYAGVAAVGTAAVTITGCSSAPTATKTNTNTPTVTKTFTATPTDTFTPTITLTFTNTVTKTYTSTFTNTFTPTITNTDTNTFTDTFTPTITNTFTNTVTKTYTPTFTNSFTATYTNTFVNTPTFTNTFTNTDTSTVTNTPTFSPTPTNTFTNTATFTDTNTFINSPTFTNTFTNTYTNTVTNTPTLSPTVTNTFTNTPTFTYTNTFMNSPTFTDTFTNTDTFTPTMTYTNTFMNTPTVTNTFTDTNTLVNTATFTPTSTYTYSATPTITFTNTFVNTATFTNTPTPTFTNTFTATYTPTSYVAMGKQVSENQVHSGDVLTYSIGVTVAGNTLTGGVVTDTLPAHMNFVSFGTVPAGVSALFISSTNQLQWTLASPLSPGVYTMTYQTKIADFAPANVPLTNFAQLNYSGAAPLTSSVPVTAIGNFTVKVNVYNSAGEVVKSIKVEAFTEPISNITLSTTNTITTLSGPGSTIDILYDGVVIGTWDGTNNSGSPVANGEYQVKIDNVDSSGTVTSVSQAAMVNRSLSTVEVDIFNEAGEVVRKLYSVAANATNSSMTNVSLSTTVIKPSLSAPTSVSSGSINYVKIMVEDSASPVTLIWDGSSDSGSLVSPGEYQVQVHWTDGHGGTSDVTRTIMVLPGTGASGIAVVRPNVLNPAKGMVTTFDASGVSGANSLKIKIYTTTGELVRTITSASAQVPWDATGMASGIYIANIEIDNASGGMINRQFLKVLVMH